MTTELITHEVSVPGVPEVTATVGVPAGWITGDLEEPAAFIAHMTPEQAGPFGDNLLVSIERLGDDAPADLEELQGLLYAQAFATVPDFHAIDDRELEVAGREGWFRASLQTTPVGITAVNRQVFTRRGDVLVTLSLTTMAFRDREHDGLFDDLLEAFTIDDQEDDA
ncbi:hypothetical protein NLU66_17080 [Brachybacterium sp. NBEC-018]|uniref:hypothetical protein n=1 Tax=Brachybacterium sp. NBEC-018 TaxID=2996004 RepID=UPI0021751A64|nr:hypothetical protein [Brachybacterium sp. NBEC-018]UVY83900.1 hypothetical protein NLU66_17080 [Brachybacterium sp. NBEC-018]